MPYTLRWFEVTERSTGSKGQAQYIEDPGQLEIVITMDDGRQVITHEATINADFSYNYIEFRDAQGEKKMFDSLYKK